MFRTFAAGLALGLLIAGAAMAEEPPSTPPDWVRKPTSEDLMGVWPRDAMYRNGRAVVACKVNTRGVLFDCVVAMERPEGAGFGAAALALTPQFLMKPATKGGAPIVSEVRIPIDFSGERMARLANPPMMRKIIANPVWLEAPSQQAVAAVYPPAAAAQRIGGHVTLVCTLDKAATPQHCDTIREQPKGAGFSKAARSLAGQFKGQTSFADGKSTKGVSVQMMFSFSPDILDGKVTASRPLWLDTPTAGDLLGTYPQPALRAGINSARVVLSCTVAPGGRLDACAVDSENPKGYDIGKAMLPVAAKFRLSPWSQDGTPLVGGNVRVPIRYAIEDKAAPAPPKP
jgi:TonB family protein